MSEPTGILGVFIGGTGERMGGVSKALLRMPGGAESLIEHAVRIGKEAGLQVVLVGAGDVGTLADVPRLPDSPADIGPLGGLGALLKYAEQHKARAIALACDMPYVTTELLRKLASDPTRADVLCPRDAVSGKWQPLFARYAPEASLAALDAAVANGERSLQAMIERAGGTKLALTPAEEALLRDWDTPEDVER